MSDWGTAREGARKVALASELSGFPVEQITGECRFRDVCEIRWAVMWAVRQRLGYSLSRIGRMFHRDHTSVIYGINRAKELIESCPHYAKLCEMIAAGDRPMICADIGMDNDWNARPMTAADIGLKRLPTNGDAILASDRREKRSFRKANKEHLRALAAHHGMGVYAGAAT